MKADKLDYKKILEDSLDWLNHEIGRQKEQTFREFLMKNYINGSLEAPDAAELKGYFEGLRVAREMVKCVLCQTVEAQDPDAMPDWNRDEEHVTCGYYDLCQKAQEGAERRDAE